MASERAWFELCRTLGRALRAGKYATVHVLDDHVRKRRSFYAPLLIALGNPLVRILNTGMRVLPQREWFEQERLLYRMLYGASIEVIGDVVLVLPRLPGETLATLLERGLHEGADRKRAIGLAVIALAALHNVGFTHGDAMAENVMIDLEAGVARWFDFETVHDTSRSMAWRCADDLRALVATCLLRTPRNAFAATLTHILESYANEEVTRLFANSFASTIRRPLAFHLGQAPLSFLDYREINRLLETIGTLRV
jgi:hypothetical protein